MNHAEEWVEEVRERQSALVQKVMDLEKVWPEGSTGQGHLEQTAHRLLQELWTLGVEITEAFVSRPVSALTSSTFAWVSYEVANARLNLTYLLLFGVNAHHATIHPLPTAQGATE